MSFLYILVIIVFMWFTHVGVCASHNMVESHQLINDAKPFNGLLIKPVTTAITGLQTCFEINCDSGAAARLQPVSCKVETHDLEIIVKTSSA